MNLTEFNAAIERADKALRHIVAVFGVYGRPRKLAIDGARYRQRTRKRKV